MPSMPKLTYRIPDEDREQKTRDTLRRWENWIMIVAVGGLVLAVLIIVLLGLLMHLAFNL